ncbi:DUF975 family protein [Liberiplasma polymorphum]|uniref:DUF975 family protein n=1 Tax=Liberiplasma polymorphum TaxID=3374570 RepID=UPI0037729A37
MKNLRTDYKSLAKSLLSGKFGAVIAFLLIVFLINIVLQSISDVFDPGLTYSVELGRFIYESGYGFFSTNGIIYSVIRLINFVITALIGYATIHLFIEVANNIKPNAGESLTEGFTENPLRTILTYLLEYVLLILWFFLFIIPFFIKTYAYAMSIFLLNKEPHINPNEAISKSQRCMKGYKMDLFILDLSFIGWYLLSILTLGILLLYVIPYHITTRTLYMEEIYEGYRRLNNPNYNNNETDPFEKETSTDPFDQY